MGDRVKIFSACTVRCRPPGGKSTFHTYPGTGHWFFEADRPDAFHPEAANLAWDRTLAFLSTKLGE